MTRIPGYVAWRESNGKPINLTPQGGPGSELAKLLRWFGVSRSKKCKCREYAAKMDRAGADWCEANIEKVVDVLRENAEKRGLPFIAFVARGMVRLAIRRARAQQSLAGASQSAGQDEAAQVQYAGQ
jgi:hypothetical protein